MYLAFSVLLYSNNSRIASRNKTAAFVLETWFIKDGIGEKGREERS